jgi:nitrogen fixation/metabolism regulation signal transduction histidine kinase
MGLKTFFRARLRDPRWVAGLLAILLAASVSTFIYLQRGRDLPAELLTNRVLLYFLWNLDAVLILVVLFVLARHLIKLALERQYRVLGTRFRTKLVLTYFALALGPVLLLFLSGSNLIRMSSDRMFSTPVREVLERGNQIAQAMNREVEQRVAREAERALDDLADVAIGDPLERSRLDERLRLLLGRSGLDYLAVFEGPEFIAAVVDPRSGLRDLPEPGRSFVAEILRNGQASRPAAPIGSRLRMTFAGLSRKQAGTVLVGGDLVDPALATDSTDLILAWQNFRQLEVQRPELVRSALGLYLLVTLLILLGAAWLGLYLARRVTIPIQALADATRRVSAGDLEHRVEVEAHDEFGVLVDSFNSMTEQVRKGRALLERSNADLKSLNARLAEAQQSAAWTEAAKRIAHEIKNPLTPIRLAAERVLAKARSAKPDAVDPALASAIEDAVATITREVDSMKTMVDEFSRFARMPQPRPSAVKVADLIEDAVRLYRGVKAGVTVHGSAEPPDLVASLDREQIRRVLINLLDNAVEATSTPGEVQATAARVGDTLELVVSDDGRGIPAADRDKLFQPYFSTKGRGTGMGLAIAQRIAVEHGGSIRVEAATPRGSRFVVTLPFADGQEAGGGRGGGDTITP